MAIISDLMGITLSQSAEKKPGTRMGRPNYPRDVRERLAAAACEPGVSVAKLARENGINANMLFTWRRRYLADRQARSAGLIPVVLVGDTPTEVVASPSVEPRVPDTKPASPVGTIEIRIGRAVVKVDGLVDADVLRTVLDSLRS
ncbi:IS66 family insertion sequence element accessory protein TnpB [Trinickia violacea]|uniref:IS66 family insertion sequence element accessory protein TnpB n=1 Tax=Trinickia violacea TaxID=2571746 RepID=A0A4P8J002_9BURK|nr:transposase [Trinickia violacea]QCP55028.1 IS66 family insertion sequence element accessory protein TnpB [Trinickia violacea]